MLMKFILRLQVVFSFLFYVSCDDGDFTYSELIFDDTNLEICRTNTSDQFKEETLVYNVNTETNEAIWALFTGNFQFSEEQYFTNNIPSGANVTYTKFSEEITAEDYFCNAISTTGNELTSELIATNGTITFATSAYILPDGDEDNDGISNQDEGFVEGYTSADFSDETIFQDSDGDDIPDFRDQDDDNDNVSTSNEYGFRTPYIDSDADGVIDFVDFIDSDLDGIPNHLDSDDDGDGVLTREEISTFNLDPYTYLNTVDLPYYLDVSLSTAFVSEYYIDNSFSTNFLTTVIVNNVSFLSDDGTTTTFLELILGKNIPSSSETFTSGLVIKESLGL